MLELTLIALVAGYAWFWYTDRRSTMEATGHIVGLTGSTLKTTGKAIKLEADIAKATNTLADIEGRAHSFTGRRSGIKSATELLDSVGIDNAYFDSRTATLADINSKIAAK